METPNNQMENPAPQTEEITLDKSNPDSIYNWVATKISGPSFRNIIKDFIDDNCSIFLDIDENTFQQGQIFNEFNQLLENILNDVLEEGGLTQEQFLSAAERGLTDQKYKKYFDQLLNFSDYNFFKRCMTKRNYALIKRFEEQIAQEKKEIEEKKLEEERERQKELEQQKIQEEINANINNAEGREKTEREKEEERQRALLFQMLNQEEEKELQEVIKQSLALEEENRRKAVIEEEELNRALKQSLLESTNPPNKPEEPKKEEPKKPDFQIQKNDNILYYNQPKPKPKEQPKEVPPPKKPIVFATTSNNSFQFSGLVQNNEEKKDIKPSNIISANKGYDFQIQSNNNSFGISSKNFPENKIEENKDINNEKKVKGEIEYKDNTFEEKKKPEIEKVEIQRKKEEIKEKKLIIDYGNNKKDIKNDNKLIEEDNIKDENNNIIVTNEIKIKNKPPPIMQPPLEEQKPSDIIKKNNENETTQTNNIIHENYEQDDTNMGGGYDRLLISDDEDDDEKPNLNSNINNNIELKPLSNAFIDKKNDYNLGKVQVGKDGGNFLNNFGGIKNYQKGGIDQLESKLKKEQFQSVVSKPNEDDDFFAKLKEVEKEKNEKLKEYREQLTKMQKEKRENKAKQTLSKEELAKLQRRELLAQKLKAKRAQENNK